MTRSTELKRLKAATAKLGERHFAPAVGPPPCGIAKKKQSTNRQPQIVAWRTTTDPKLVECGGCKEYVRSRGWL
jgi:hypothetical protein